MNRSRRWTYRRFRRIRWKERSMWISDRSKLRWSLNRGRMRISVRDRLGSRNERREHHRAQNDLDYTSSRRILDFRNLFIKIIFVERNYWPKRWRRFSINRRRLSGVRQKGFRNWNRSQPRRGRNQRNRLKIKCLHGDRVRLTRQL